MKKQDMSRRISIVQAAVEYFIAILVSGTFLATLTGELGMNDSLTAILSSIASLGCVFQLLSMFLHKKRGKPFVIVTCVLNQMLFLALYMIPLWNMAKEIKIILFMAAIFIAYFFYHIASPVKTNWLMSLVDDRVRGSFSAKKEIVSLASGMLFSFGMGALVDYYGETGQLRTGFGVVGMIILLLSVLHTVFLAGITEKEVPQPNTGNVRISLQGMLHNREIMGVTVIFILYYLGTYCAVPFYGTYMIRELNLSLKYVSVMNIVGSLARIAVSMFWGRYADRKSFAAMIQKCFGILILAYVCVIFAVPANGAVMFALYHILQGIAMGGVNSALVNLVFDYAEQGKRADSLAVCQATAGVVGFIATLAVSPILTTIQGNGNTLLGIPVYAQQFLSLIGAGFLLAAMWYVKKHYLDRNRK